MGKLWYIQTMENYLVMGRSELVKKSWRKQCILQIKEARLKGSILYDSHYDILENRTTGRVEISEVARGLVGFVG